ncbi:MAG: hypothetical protein ABJ084_07535 [Halioglobus sp.]
MNRFNLSFKGTTLPGYELERVQTRLANALGLPGPESTAPFFSGKPVTLRRNLDRKVAADWYRKLRDIGMDVELIKSTDAVISDSETKTDKPIAAKDQPTSPPASPAAKHTDHVKDSTKAAPTPRRGMSEEIHQSKPGQVDQSWAVPSSSQTAPDKLNKAGKAEVSDEQRRAKADATARLAAEHAAEIARQKQLEADVKRKAQERQEREREQKKERDRKDAELAAQREAQAKRDAQERKKAREAAEREAKQRARAALEAKLKAQLETEREAEAQAERDRLAEEEAQRQRDEQLKAEQLAAAEAARAHAAVLEEKRKAAARLAAQKAEEKERKRVAAQALAAKKAQEKQRKAQEAARAKAEREAERARIKAEREEVKRKAQAIAEQARAEQEQRRAKAREEALRIKAEKAEAARLAAEHAAREKAREEAQRKQRDAELAERRARQKEAELRAAAEAAHKKAEEEHRKAEAAAKLLAQQEEARLAQKLARTEAEQARKAEIAAQKQQEAVEKRRKAEAKAKQKASEQAEREKQQALALAERAKLEEQVIETGAARLKDASTGTTSKPRVKTRLEVPTRSSHASAAVASPVQPATTDDSSKGVSTGFQRGAPNFYTLTAFHNSQELKQRPAESAAKARRGMLAVAAMLVVLALSITAFALRSPVAIQRGPIGITSNSDGELLVLVASAVYIHDRAGLGTLTLTLEELGLSSLQPPLHFNTDGDLIGLGALQGSSSPLSLIRCQLPERHCTAAIEQSGDPAASATPAHFAINALNNDLYLLSETPAVLHRFNAQGDLLADAELPIAAQPTLRLDSGLIFINSEFDSAISVFRPDIADFGQQLDEVLLMPPPAVANQHDLVLDFLPIDEQWWAVLGDPKSQTSALYRFDASWRFISDSPLPAAYYPARLARWNDKLLVSHPSQIEQIRLSKEGVKEAQYQSDLLLNAVSANETTAAWQGLLGRAVPALLMALILIAIGYTWAYRLRSRVYQHSKTRGAGSLDDSSGIDWVDPYPQRISRYRQLALLMAAGYGGVLVASIGLGLPTSVLAAILLALSGPAVTLYMLYRAPVGFIGSRDDTLVLVDHNGLYHMGAGPRIQYQSRFVLIDDVVVFTGASLLPTFEPKQLKALESAITAGVKVESKAVWIRLLQAQHPLAIGSIACALGIIMAALILVV